MGWFMVRGLQGDQVWSDSGLVQTLFIHGGPSHRKIESQKIEKMHQQAKHELTDAW